MRNLQFPLSLVLLLSLSLLLFSACSGNRKVNSAAQAGKFQYDPGSGKCKNQQGETGLNPISLEEVHASKNCECANLSGMNLVDLLPGVEEGMEHAYNELKGYNFRGADFSEASLHFNHILESDFQGAKMKDFSFGYARIAGQTDAFTELPEGCDSDKAGQMDCSR